MSLASNIGLVLFLLLFASFAVERRKDFIRMVQLKTYNCVVYTKFQHKKYTLYKISAWGCLLKIFVKFHKFQPRYFYKTYSQKKNIECSESPFIYIEFIYPKTLFHTDAKFSFFQYICCFLTVFFSKFVPSQLLITSHFDLGQYNVVSRRKQSLIQLCLFRLLQSVSSLADKCFVSQIIFCVNAATVKHRWSNIKRLYKLFYAGLWLLSSPLLQC